MFGFPVHFVDTQSLLRRDPVAGGNDGSVDADGDTPCGHGLPGMPGRVRARFAVTDQPIFAVKERFIRERAAVVVKIVVCFRAVLAVYRICDDIVDLRGVEKLSVSAFDSVIPAVPFKGGYCITVQQKRIQHFNKLYGIRIDLQKRMLFSAFLTAYRDHAGGEPASGPFPGSAQGMHIVGDTLRGIFPFQLCKGCKNVHNRASHGRGCVEALFDRQEGDIVFLEYFIHGGKFLHIPADTIQLVYNNHIQRAVADILHKFLKTGAVGIFA